MVPYGLDLYCKTGLKFCSLYESSFPVGASIPCIHKQFRIKVRNLPSRIICLSNANEALPVWLYFVLSVQISIF